MYKVIDEISSPHGLFNFMSENITYGYLGKDGRVYSYEDADFDEKWFNEYILESYEDVLRTMHGNCWDQVEFERYWFEKNGYEVKTIYTMVELNYDNNYPTHSFLIFKDKDNSWNWFENADFVNRGIHKFDSIDELLNYQYDNYIKFLKTFNISDDEIEKIIYTEYDKPKSNISASDYLKYVVDSKQIFINKKNNKSKKNV